MFSTPTTTMTKGKIQDGKVDSRCEDPHPFHPKSTRMLKLMIAEQHNCTMPVKARP